MNENYDDNLRPAPLTFREKFILGALMAVTGLWTILLVEGVEWIVWVVKGWFV